MYTWKYRSADARAIAPYSDSRSSLSEGQAPHFLPNTIKYSELYTSSRSKLSRSISDRSPIFFGAIPKLLATRNAHSCPLFLCTVQSHLHLQLLPAIPWMLHLLRRHGLRSFRSGLCSSVSVEIFKLPRVLFVADMANKRKRSSVALSLIHI